MEYNILIVGITTTNYGNRLQNYALQEELKALGCNVETINRSVEEKNKIKRLLLNIKDGIKQIFRWVLKLRRYSFQRFDKRIAFSRYSATANEADAAIADSYDYFVVGSDQVWNPYYDFVGQVDLLTFAKSEQKISYAASFGVSELPGENKELYKAALSDFKAISVREYQGAKIVKELTGRDVPVVLDPTLLFDGEWWKQVEKKPRFLTKNKYFFVYILGEVEGAFSAVKDSLISEGYICVDAEEKKHIYSIGPSEFLYLIDHAEYVLTNSFHATVFSILFRKKVHTFKRKGMDMSSRIVSLAQIVGMDKSFKENGNFIVEDLSDYATVDECLNVERQKSVAYLRKALEIE